jgi:hypothetical protein
VTLHQISEGTASYFNFLTTACSQDRIDVVIGFFLFGGDTIGLSVAIRYGSSKSYASTHNLVTTIESPLGGFLVVITLPSKNFNQIAILVDFSSL